MNAEQARAKYEKFPLITEQPSWFREIVGMPMIEGAVNVDGSRVHYLEFGDRSKPSMVLVHGNGAHAWWFLPMGQMLAKDWHVVAITLTGMGDSDWRPQYTRETLADDVIGVIDHLGLDKPMLVGHSFGGLITLAAAGKISHRLAGLILMDFVVRTPEHHVEWFADRTKNQPRRIYPSFEAALGRFRLLPEQVCANAFFLRWIAERSVCTIPQGWSWKFDPTIYDNMRVGTDLPETLNGLQCPLGCVFGEDTLEFERSSLTDMVRLSPKGTPFVKVTDAQHHLMLDQPHKTTEVVSTMATQLTAVSSSDVLTGVVNASQSATVSP